MQTLAAMGTEIMWCDIGGPNMTTEFAMQYFNDAAARGKQVLLNNRCGLPGDFDTPEYARYESVQVRKWESNLGMDPFSYGYNRATPKEAYITPAAIVTSLLDIVSKNGNLLLDIGPTANGTIIEIEQRNLRIAGAWIKEHAEAIFNTTYWFVTPEEGQAVRFTQNANAFYIATLYPPNRTLVLDSPVPYVEGDEVKVVGGNLSGAVVPSRLLSNGSLELTVSEEVKMADRFAWVFKIGFGGVEAESGPGNGSAVVVDGNANGTTNGSRPGGTGSPIATQASSGVGGVRTGVFCSTMAAVAVVMLVASAC
jgi:alpha-L-fucosidase